MIVIGVDFSIQYPAVCISRDFTNFSWIACVNTSIPKSYQKFLLDIEMEFQNVQFIPLEPREKNWDTYSQIERSKLSNYAIMIDTLVKAIKNEIGDDDRLVVSMEGIAYGAKGNALIDICQATGMMRKTILDDLLLGRSEKVFIFSPAELKNAIGAKGNAGKFDVYNAFISDPKLAIGSDLHKILTFYDDKIIKGQEIKSPFMDMIDAYAAVLKVHAILKEPALNVES